MTNDNYETVYYAEIQMSFGMKIHKHWKEKETVGNVVQWTLVTVQVQQRATLMVSNLPGLTLRSDSMFPLLSL